jgi:hypothetical protein
MNSANGLSPTHGFLRGLVRKLAAVVEECRYAQRKMAVLRTAPDMYSARPDAAPDTYAEFLFRTSGLLLHEPPARARGRGSLLR